MNETIESQKEEICRAHQGDERRRQDQQLLHEQFLKQNWDLREAHEKSLNDMEELKRFQCSTFFGISRRRLVEHQDTILELTGKIQELQNEIDCMNDSRDIQDAESVRSGHSHVASQPVSVPLFPDPGGMPSRSLGMPSRKMGPPSIWDTHMVCRETFFANPAASSSAPLSTGIEIMVFSYIRTNSLLTGGEEWKRSRSEMPVRTLSQKFSHPSEGDSSNNYGADQQRLQISDRHFDKFPTLAKHSLVEDKIQD